MKCSLPSSLVLLCLAVTATLGEVTYTVTGFQKGKAIQASKAVLKKYPPSLDRLNRTHDRHNQPPPAVNASAGWDGSKTGRRASKSTKITNTVTISGNWCGVVNHSPSTNPITSVHALFTVPKLKSRTKSYPQYVSPWVGIDGATWGSALLQAGVTSQYDKSGAVTSWAWLEWIPDAAYTIPDFPVAAGDLIEITVSAPTATSGIIDIANHNQSTGYTITLSNGTPLGRIDADWILEDPATVSDGVRPFAKFSDTTFQNCNANTANNTAIGINTGGLYYLSGNTCTASIKDNARFLMKSS